VCILCKFHKQDCTYNEAPKPRKRNASRDDALLGFPGTKRSRTIQTTPGTGVEEYDALPDGSTLLKRTLGLQNLHHSRYIGPNDVLDVQTASHFDQLNLHKSNNRTVKVRFVHPDHAFRILDDSATVGHVQEADALNEIQRSVCGHGQELVRLYFRVVHPAFPVLHKQVFLEKYSRSLGREFSPPLLAAVYLLASGYWSFSETLSALPKPDLAPLSRLAWVSLQSARQRAKLSTVQAYLLLSQFRSMDAGTLDEESGRQLTAQLVDLSYQLGLHLDPADWDVPEWEIGLRRRLGWAVYIQDKWSALLAGRPSLIVEDAWCVISLSVGDFPELDEDMTAGSSEVEKGRLVFTQLASLSVLLGDILTNIFSPRSKMKLPSGSERFLALLDRIKPLQIRLKEWFSTLPDSLKMDTAASMKLSSVGYLRLAYLTVEICLHRQLVRAMPHAALYDNALIPVFRKAAKERFTNAVDFIRRLQALHLASFWYFTSAHCCALIYNFGTLLERTAVEDTEKTEFGQGLQEYRWCLKLHSEAGARFMKHALTLIDLSSKIIITTSGECSLTTSPVAAINGDSPAVPARYPTITDYVSPELLESRQGNIYDPLQMPPFDTNSTIWSYDLPLEYWTYQMNDSFLGSHRPEPP